MPELSGAADAPPLPLQPTRLRVELSEHVLMVTLNRPEKLNAFDRVMQDELEQVWRWADSEADVRVALITGAGERAFCSGVDIHDAARERATLGERRWSDISVIGSRLTPRQCSSDLPTVCAINGVCAGGGLYFVGDADICVCSDNAFFTDPHVSFGRVSALEPIGLSRLIPYQWVMRLSLGGRHEGIDPTTALRIGLVTEVFAGVSALREGAFELARRIATGEPLALRGTVRAVRRGLDLPRDQALDQGLRVAQENTRTRDHEEGVTAQLEKRQPRWEGR